MSEVVQTDETLKVKAPTDYYGIVGMVSVFVMYFTWTFLLRALIGKEDTEGGIGVFLIVLSQFFMGIVPKLREKPLTFKVVALNWLLLPIIYTAVMALLMAGIDTLFDAF